MNRTLSAALISIVFLLNGFVGEAAQGRWELLGRQQVDFHRDHDRIDVGRREGKFRQLQLHVEGAPVEIRRMVVTFGDDKKFDPNVRRRFDESSRSHVIDLPGDRRVIKRIDFEYVSPNRRAGKATVEVYAR